jgi:rod shape-determining protein MreD
MRLALPGLAALAAALAELAVAPHFSLSGAHVHLVLVLGVIATVALGVETGLVWAFVGGIALDVLAGRPLGATALALLVVLGGTGVAARYAARLRLFAPILLVPICSVLSSALFAVTLGVLGAPVDLANPGSRLLAGALADTVLGIAVGPLVIALVDRRAQRGHVYA